MTTKDKLALMREIERRNAERDRAFAEVRR